MGRLLCADSEIQTTLANLLSTESHCTGLMIGQHSGQRDFVLHLCKTPVQDNDVDAQATGEPAEFDEKWIAKHAKQALSMLPGGLDILGIFLLSSPDVLRSSQSRLLQTLFTVQKTVGRCEAELQQNRANATTYKHILQICTATKKNTCKTIDVSDYKAPLEQAEWKYQDVMSQFVAVSSTLALRSLIPVARRNCDDSLKKQLIIGAAPLCKRLWRAHVVVGSAPDSSVGGRSANCVEHLLGTALKRASKHSPRGDPSARQRTLTAELYLANDDGEKDVEKTECVAKLYLRGSIAGRAYVHQKASIADAEMAIKEDLVRSLVFRCNLLCEDLLQNEETEDPKVLYETPVRVFAPLGQRPGGVAACDYMFADEKNADSVARFRELLALNQLTEEDLETGCEALPKEEDIAAITAAESRDEPTSKFGSTEGATAARGAGFRCTFANLSLIFAILFGGLAMLYYFMAL